jgi:hypothetical protein
MDQTERDLFTRGIDVMKKQIGTVSDMEYYFRMYGKIENYLFPEIRRILLARGEPYTDYQLEFLNEFKGLIQKTGCTEYSEYFVRIVPNTWMADYALQ